MKIVHLGLCVDGKNEGLPFALKKASTEYFEINPGDPQIVSKLRNLPFKPDLVFCQIQSETIQGSTKVVPLIGHILKDIRDAGAFVMNWSGDMRDVTPGWYFDMAEYVSMTTFSNMQDVANLRARGFKSDFLQIGIDPEVFRPDGEKMDVPEIVFMANNYGNQFPLSRFRVQVVDFLKDNYGGRFKVFGNGWKPGEQSLNHSQYEEAKAYRGAKIAISVSHFNSDRYTSDRLFRALACGVPVISHKYEGIETDFVIGGGDLQHFEKLPELKQKIDYWLNNPHAANAVGANGCKTTHEKFTYKNMVQHILTLAK